MKGGLSWDEAIEQILTESLEPLHYKEITDRIISKGLRTNFGAIPSNCVHTALSKSNKYVKFAKGIFALKSTLENRIKDSEQEDQTNQSSLSEKDGEEDSIVSSFGMFWRREEVEWKSSANLELLGAQRGEADPVNFSQQIGLYLLYDRREVIYVGRAEARTLGGRLYDHTKDRLSARWDQFSWFGFLPVSENGELGERQSRYDSDRMIAGIEAILIEALEPRQNRKRGDDLEAVEYLQKENPNLMKKKVVKIIQEMIP